MTAESIPQRIRRARRARHWSQTRLGQELDPPRSHVAISYIESGHTRLTLDLLVELSRELEVPVAWLLAPILDEVP